MMMRHARAVGRNVLSRHGTVAAYLALFLASSAAVYAAATIGSPEVINNSLQSIDLRDGLAVKGVDVVNESLTGADINESTLSSILARGTGVRVLSNRAVVPTGTNVAVTFLELDGLGVLKADCAQGDIYATVYWSPPNSSVDYWSDQNSTGALVPGSTSGATVTVAFHEVASDQRGSTLQIGYGGYGLQARMATVTIGFFRPAVSAACSVQAMATIWTKP